MTNTGNKRDGHDTSTDRPAGLHEARSDMLADTNRRLEGEVAERRQAEEALRSVLRSARCLLWQARVEYREDTFHWDLWFPEAAAAQQFLPLEVRPGESYASAWAGSILEEDGARVDRVSREALRSGKRCYTREYRCRQQDGEVRWLYEDVQVQPAGPQQWRLVGICTDITERKRSEEEIIRLERLHALEEMAQGVAHNFNNLMVGVLGYSQILKTQVSSPEAEEYVELLIESALRAKQLVQRLNVSLRGEDTQVVPVPVNRVVTETVQAARPRWKDEPEARGITVDVVMDLQEVPPLKGTRSGLQDILLNLLRNAVDALPGGGAIRIRTRAVGGGVEILVEDDGIGMTEETRRRVFEPFFTTKSDVGSGLGLSGVYGRVVRWEGRIDVESTPGQGTVFRLWIPASTEALPAEKEEPEAAPETTRRATVLIVEDAEVVRDVLCNVLSREHDVRVFPDGREALAAFSPGCCDVALIDLGMPGEPGDLVARKMQEIDPSIVTVLITGWEFPEDDPRVKRFDFRLQKPFENLSAVRHTLALAVALRDRRLEG